MMISNAHSSSSACVASESSSRNARPLFACRARSALHQSIVVERVKTVADEYHAMRTTNWLPVLSNSEPLTDSL